MTTSTTDATALAAHDPPGPAVAVGLVIGSMTSLQFGAAIATHLFPQVGAAGASALRLGLSAIVLAIVGRPNVRRWTREQRTAVVLLGLTMACMNTAFYEAVDRLPLGAAITIEFLGPLGLAVILTRRLRDLLWVGLALGGVLILSAAQGLGRHGRDAAELDPVGIAFALVAATFWALYIVAGSRVARSGPPKGALAGSCAVASVFVVPYGLAVAGAKLGTPSVLGWGVLVAVLASAIPYSFEIRALERLAKRTFSILTALEPAVGVAAGLVLLDQRLRPLSLVGVVLVVAAGIGATATAPPADQPVLIPDSS